jgi:Phage portal protein
VGVLQRVASALGFPSTVGVSSLVSSPWADASSLADVDLSALFYLGMNVKPTRANAMKLAVVARVRNVVAPTIGRLPLNPVDRLGVVQPPTTFLASLDPTRPRSSTLTWLVDQLIFYPQTWLRVTARDAFGWPMYCELVMHDDAQLDPAGNVLKVKGHPIGDDQPAGYQLRDLIRFDSPSSGLLADGDRALARAYAIEMAAAKAEDNPVPAFELHDTSNDTLTPEEIAQRVQTWIVNRRRFGVAWTSKGIETKNYGVQPEQLLIDGRKRVDQELVRHMNAQAWIADVAIDGTSLTYANLNDKGRDLVNFTLAPYMEAVTGRLSMGDITPRGTTVAFNTDAITRPDMKARFDAYKVGIDGGFVTKEQIANWEGWQA